MTAQPARPLGPDDGRAGGLAEVQHVIAVSSCKGGAPPALAEFVNSLRRCGAGGRIGTRLQRYARNCQRVCAWHRTMLGKDRGV